MKSYQIILIALFLMLFINGCSTRSYGYYPIPAVYLLSCRLPEDKPETIRDLHYQYEWYKMCAVRGNEDKERIKDLINGDVL